MYGNIGISMLKEFEVENNIRYTYTGHTTIIATAF